MDQIILKIIGENWMTIYMAITLLKGVAILTPTVKDDKIITLISNIYSSLRSGKAPDSIPE